MTKAFPPSRPRGGGWAALAVVLGLLVLAAPPGLAQQPGHGAHAMPGANQGQAPGDAKAKADEPRAAPAPPKREEPERYEDPRAAEALASTFELSAPPLSPADRNLVLQMALGQVAVDANAIDRYVKSLTSDLTRRLYLKALTDPAGNPSQAKAIEVATAGLLEPLNKAPANNPRFRQVYVARLIENFKPLWKGHLHSRTMAMIVLSRAGDSQALPVFAAQLNDPDQLAIVKLLAAVGITHVTSNGRSVDTGRAVVDAARALSGFLRREPDTFWPAQFRALEALGCLRVATAAPLEGKAEFADTAMMILLDSKARARVRVWAAWALGMMQVPAAVQGYNFSKVAQAAGQVAVDLGTRVGALSDADLANGGSRLTELLVQLDLAFTGESDIRNSGLLNAGHQSALRTQAYVAEVAKRVRAVTKASLELSNSVGVQIPARRKALGAAVEDLRTFLAKPVDGGPSLYAGGPDLAAAPGAKVDGGARP